jgi:hypothetical protein
MDELNEVEDVESLTSVIVNVDLDEIQVPDTYEECRDKISQVLRNAEMSVVLACWIVGRMVSEAVENSTYGDGVVLRLSEDLKRSTTILYDSKKFYEEYPAHRLMVELQGIAWSNIRQLIAIPDVEVRNPLIESCKESQLTVAELKELIAMTINTAEDPAVVEAEAEEPEEEEEEEEGFTTEAIQYFSRLDAVLEAFQEDITEIIAKLPEMKVLAIEDEVTSEEDYELILEKGLDISVKARAIGEFINLNLYGLNSADSFQDSEGE